MNGSTSSLVPTVLYVLGATGGVAALYSAWLNRRRPLMELGLLAEQTATQRAERESKAVEASHKAVESVSRALDRAEALAVKLERELEAAETREKLHDEQLRTLNARRIVDEAKIAELEEKLRQWSEAE